MPKSIETSVASGLVRMLPVPICTIDENLIREVAGTRYLIEQRPVIIFRSILNSVIRTAEVIAEFQQVLGVPMSESEKRKEICLATAEGAKANGLFERGSSLLCEGSARMIASTHTYPDVFWPIGVGEHHILRGKYRAAVCHEYDSVTHTAMRRYFAGEQGAIAIRKFGGMVVLEDAVLYSQGSAEPEAEYAMALVPFNEPDLQIYRARKI